MKTVIALSGGLDSTCLLAKCLDYKDHLICVGFNYGSKHNQYENQAASKICWDHYKIPFHLMDLTPLFKDFRSSLLKTGDGIPEGHYQEGSMKSTVVPCRNMIFASILAGLAESHDCETIQIAVHAGDHHIYPDCRPGFIDSMRSAILVATDNKVLLKTPFLYLTKTEVLSEGLQVGAPLQFTRTCYKDQVVACGKCGSCIERLEAFKENGVADPLSYENS